MRKLRADKDARSHALADASPVAPPVESLADPSPGTM